MSTVFNNLFYLTEQTSAFNLRIVAKNNRLSLPPKDFTKMPKPIVNFFLELQSKYEYITHSCLSSDKQVIKFILQVKLYESI